jgi:hypothetical protein
MMSFLLVIAVERGRGDGGMGRWGDGEMGSGQGYQVPGFRYTEQL